MLLLDAGHGGLLRGRYTTRGKMFDHGPLHQFHAGGIIYEGLINRAIVNSISEKLDRIHFPNIIVSDPALDTSLSARVKLANEKAPRNSLYMSVHANASKTHRATGWEVFHAPGSAAGERAAKLLHAEAVKVLGGRTPDRGVKSANFFVLANTKMPAILSENLFFDNINDAKILFESGIIDAIAQAHVNAALRFFA